MPSSRREFLEAGAGSILIGSTVMAAQSNGQQQIPRKPLGKTGVQVSAIGLGGYHLGSAEDEKQAKRIVDEALDGGINFFDNAWEYHEGKSEEWLGSALKGKRDQAIVMTKVFAKAM